MLVGSYLDATVCYPYRLQGWGYKILRQVLARRTAEAAVGGGDKDRLQRRQGTFSEGEQVTTWSL
jgi:hypothetical protein